jgi:hypothetical protein
MDVIDRQAALEAMDTWDKFGCDPDGKLVRYDDDKHYIPYVHYEDMVHAIKHLPSAQQWIPCSERLPEEKDAGILKKLGTEKRSEYVLATVEVKGERMTVTACTYDGKWDWNMKYAFPEYEIVAWMPLPEPWEGGQE